MNDILRTAAGFTLTVQILVLFGMDSFTNVDGEL